MPSPILVNDLSGYYWRLPDGGRQALSEEQWKLEMSKILSKKREETRKPRTPPPGNVDDVLEETGTILDEV